MEDDGHGGTCDAGICSFTMAATFLRLPVEVGL